LKGGIPVFQIATYEKYSDGQVIFKEGTHGDWLYIVDEGAVEISRLVNDTKVLIATFKEGEIFGEVAYIAKIERSATATAIGDTTIGIIDRDNFDNEFNKLSGDFQVIVKTLALRLKKTTDALMELQK
jgi:CRP-like cAMP-binding protein